MNKLKGWQIALLIIFYPIGILYLIYRIAVYFTNSTPPSFPSSNNAYVISERLCDDYLSQVKKRPVADSAAIQ